MTQLNLRERTKGLVGIVVSVASGFYTYPPVLACAIVAWCADEFHRIAAQQGANVEHYSNLEATHRPKHHPHAVLNPRHRILFVSACIVICLSALVSQQAMTGVTLFFSLGALTYLLFRHIEQPGHRQPVPSAVQRAAAKKAEAEQMRALPDAPPPSQLLQPSSPLASVHMFYSVVIHIVGLWYAGFLWSHSVLVWRHASLPEGGTRRLMYVIITTAGGENGGMLFGSQLGRTKLTPHISPNKSREGALAQILTSIVVSVAFAHYVEVDFAFIEAVVLGALLGFGGTMGDLFESFLKRSVGVKDAGSLIPGAGGMLDRMDGLIFNFPLMFYWLEYAHATFVPTRLVPSGA